MKKLNLNMYEIILYWSLKTSYETYFEERGIEKKSSLMDRQVSLIESACCTIERSHNFKFRCIARSMDK